MNNQRSNDAIVKSALPYANMQIDNFLARGRLTFSELAVMVEALYAMSGISGCLLFSYAIASRAKQLILEERGFFTIQDTNADIDHMVPLFLRELRFFTDNKIRYDGVKFVPLFATTFGASTVVLKDIVWVRSTQKSNHIPVLLGSNLMDANAVINNRFASVTVPVVYLADTETKFGLIQLKSSIFDVLQTEVAKGSRAMRLRKAFGGKNVELKAENNLPALDDENITSTVYDAWPHFTEYAKAISVQNGKMPKNVVDSTMHTLIFSQKPLSELSKMIFG